MPITPAEAAEWLEWEKHALPRWEAYIDAEIRSLYAANGDLWVSLSVPSMAITPRIRARLILDYEAAGWTVKLHHDQREGDSLHFAASHA